MKALKNLFGLCFLISISLVIAGCSSGESAAKKNTKTDFPKKSIELIIGYSAGGGTDVVARHVIEAVNKHMPNGQSIVAVNKPGGSGTIALAEVMKAKPDGYTLGSVTTGNLAIQPNYGKTPYESDGFIPIAQFNSAQNLLVVQADAPWKTYDEWLEYVKKNPGKFSYATAGAGNTQHLAMEALNIKEKIKTKHVPFDGAAPGITALLGGHVDGAVILTQEAKQHTESGALRVLANMGTTELSDYKDAAFLKDQGYVGLDTWSGVVAPKNTPKEVIEILQEAFKKGLEEPELKEKFKKIGLEPAYAGSEEFAKNIKESNKVTNDVAEQIGLTK
ncbi:Bug family tripartite tricarboxylate transporter substrate binding protein [Bacillus sp. EB01]|uniref:Bug family tripartite tricarboxylate transporter substrate binding protein n=1 Tax=Bacillus sp. EB01 TaxID=1347086 RepID=UPI0005C4DBF3|nr:tripartite tricarboxylate transporter substrate binding protein [Bacillus sp. EB01]